ncbi:class I SAM-dependent rRNA methyltransferase [Magnetospirillum sulfuroxidans]|uniref:Class I SAM-dependent rRNA methyltransferase n=1 Tax=Magnetospirillum sulfuroxidans TaxID=611300 RepID=A0ABS5IFJ1_9PROT|nr:class I SAM-dependent rRNA methyltransferase [Magnetospirillum sulfuroxidans]MBR9973192.1 class I SAM-dependent rRNA methyltransferase [Magnetospirillum sulfuroxidans]
MNIIPSARPIIRFAKGRSRRFRAGHPWVFSNEIEMSPELKTLPAGTLVTLMDAGDEKLGVASFNPHSLICARVLSRHWTDVIDAGFIAGRLRAALALRDSLFPMPHYRLIHSEADNLPGLIVDRYGDVVVLQVNTAGMEALIPTVLEALTEVLAPRAVVLKNDSPVRGLEGLPLEHKLALGVLDGPVELIENGARFVADLTDGQKTGWFYDQRDNRAFVAGLAAGKRMLDVYTYAGGFAVQAALAGAVEVVAVDRSEHSLALADKAAELNSVTINTVRAEAFAEMTRLAAAGERFGVVVVDPPAFVKSRKDVGAGAKGYRKMTRLAAPLVEAGGFLLCASCSHHMPAELFAEEIAHGLGQAGRSGRILRIAGASADHPLHPQLPESAYLKALILQLD